MGMAPTGEVGEVGFRAPRRAEVAARGLFCGPSAAGYPFGRVSGAAVWPWVFVPGAAQ